MRQEEKFNNILNECLDRILKGESVENCLHSYPEQSRELEPLLRTAQAARVISSIQPRPEFKIEAKRRFQAALIEMKVQQNERKAHAVRRWHWRLQPGWAIALVLVVIVVLGGGGTVIASSGSMPDSNLYPVKLAAEKVQLALSYGDITRTELNAKFADRRTEEIIYVAEQGNAQEVQVLAGRLNTNLSNITELAAGKSRSVADNSEQPSPVAAPQSGLAKNAAPPELNAPAPAAVSQPAFGVLSVPADQLTPDASGVGSAVPTVAAPAFVPSPAAPVPAAGARSAAPASSPLLAQSAESTATSGAALSNDQTGQPAQATGRLTRYDKLRQIIQENYQQRQQKLEEALQNAPPGVRPAIRQAIAQSELEYQRALKKLEEAQNAQKALKPAGSGAADDPVNTRTTRNIRQ